MRGVGYRIVVEDDAPALIASVGPRPGGRRIRRLDRDGDRATRGVVRGVGAVDPAAARIASTERIEVEVRLTGRRQTAAARRTGDRRVAAVADGGRCGRISESEGWIIGGHLPGWAGVWGSAGAGRVTRG